MDDADRSDADRADGFAPGASVVGADGQPVGTLVAAAPTYLIVEHGAASELYVPIDAIASSDEERVTLNLTRDEALAASWETGTPSFVGFAATEQLAPGIPLAGHVDDLGTTEDDGGEAKP